MKGDRRGIKERKIKKIKSKKLLRQSEKYSNKEEKKITEESEKGEGLKDKIRRIRKDGAWCDRLVLRAQW